MSTLRATVEARTSRRAPPTRPAPPSLAVVLREWGRIGCIGFGGPPAHIALLRELCVERRGWLDDREFEDAIAATNLLPGPASTQLAIYCAPASWRRAAAGPRWIAYLLAGGLAAATLGAGLVLVLLGCGAIEVALRRVRSAGPGVAGVHPWPLLATAGAASGGLLALAWVAFKVGALSYGGGFVIIPLMQHDAVDTYHWMTDGQFLNAVALGQVTPGPVVQTVAVVGYAAAGIGGGLLAALVAFAPSFSFILIGAERFDRLRANLSVRAFLDGAGPAAIGAIAGAALPLALALSETWQIAVLAAAAMALFVLRRGVVLTLIAAGGAGALARALGAPLPS
jgi:chromate transporter